MEALIKAGCFDDFGSRKEFLDCFEHFMDRRARELEQNVSGQLDLFGAMFQEPTAKDEPKKIAKATPYEPDDEDLKLEKEVLGLYISGHPLKQFQKKLKSMGADSLPKALEEYRETGIEREYTFIGVIAGLNVRTTKTGNRMAFFTLEELSGNVPCVAFSDFFVRHTDAIIEENIVVATGKFSRDHDDSIRFILTRLDRFDTKLNYLKLYLRLPGRNHPVMEEVKKLLTFFSGDTPVFVYFEDEKQLMKAPKSLFVSENRILMEKLTNLLGEENVKLVND